MHFLTQVFCSKVWSNSTLIWLKDPNSSWIRFCNPRAYSCCFSIFICRSLFTVSGTFLYYFMCQLYVTYSITLLHDFSFEYYFPCLIHDWCSYCSKLTGRYLHQNPMVTTNTRDKPTPLQSLPQNQIRKQGWDVSIPERRQQMSRSWRADNIHRFCRMTD